MLKKLWASICLFIISTAALAGTCSSLLTVSYFYPTDLWSTTPSPWATLNAHKTSEQIVIINPASGPGTASNPDYVNALTNAKAAGYKVLGYVSTNYGNRPYADANDDVLKYKTWYPTIDGIFLDEVPTTAAKVAYYQNRVTNINGKFGATIIVLNQGTQDPTDQYMHFTATTGTRFINVTFEGDYSNYLTVTWPAWMQTFPAKRFAHIIKNVPSANLVSVMELASEANAFYVYPTDSGAYNVLPTEYTTKIMKETAGN